MCYNIKYRIFWVIPRHLVVGGYPLTLIYIKNNIAKCHKMRRISMDDIRKFVGFLIAGIIVAFFVYAFIMRNRDNALMCRVVELILSTMIFSLLIPLVAMEYFLGKPETKVTICTLVIFAGSTAYEVKEIWKVWKKYKPKEDMEYEKYGLQAGTELLPTQELQAESQNHTEESKQ